MAINYFDGPRGNPGTLVSLTNTAGQVQRAVIPAVTIASATDGSATPAGSATDPYNTQSGALPAGTDRSGSATTSSTQTIAANPARRGLNIQNVGANNIGVNEFGGTAAIGTAGTYTLAAGATMNVRTNRAITMIAATAATPFTATEF